MSHTICRKIGRAIAALFIVFLIVFVGSPQPLASAGLVSLPGMGVGGELLHDAGLSNVYKALPSSEADESDTSDTEKSSDTTDSDDNTETDGLILRVETSDNPELESLPLFPLLAPLSEESETGKGVFEKGAVTLRFDDGWLSQYENAVPKMEEAGFQGTFYIVTEQTADDGFPGFMSRTQIENLYRRGEEIGAHTETHTDLKMLPEEEQRKEIEGSREKLRSWDAGPILTFAYPYGSYSTTTMKLVKEAGFTSAAAAIDGNVTPASDRYQLERRGVEADTSFSEVAGWIDAAAENNEWLILSFHQIDRSGGQYSTTPETFDRIIDYLKAKDLPVVTLSEGVQSLK